MTDEIFDYLVSVARGTGDAGRHRVKVESSSMESEILDGLRGRAVTGAAAVAWCALIRREASRGAVA